MAELKVERLEADAYRLWYRNNEPFIVDAQGLRDIEAFATLHMRELEAEAKQAEAVKRYNQEMDARTHIVAENREKPWLPGEEQNESMPAPSWREIEATAERDLAAIQNDQDAYTFIEKYLSRDLRGRYMAIYRSDRHEMNRSPAEAVKNLLALPPLE